MQNITIDLTKNCPHRSVFLLKLQIRTVELFISLYIFSSCYIKTQRDALHIGI